MGYSWVCIVLSVFVVLGTILNVGQKSIIKNLRESAGLMRDPPYRGPVVVTHEAGLLIGVWGLDNQLVMLDYHLIGDESRTDELNAALENAKDMAANPFISVECSQAIQRFIRDSEKYGAEQKAKNVPATVSFDEASSKTASSSKS